MTNLYSNIFLKTGSGIANQKQSEKYLALGTRELSRRATILVLPKQSMLDTAQAGAIVQLSLRWYLCAREGPYALHPIRSFPNVAFETVLMLV